MNACRMPLECDSANSRTTCIEFSRQRRPNSAPGRTPRRAELGPHRHAPARTGARFIRLTSARKVFFNRSDRCEATSFHGSRGRPALTFELLEDAISGPPALRVEGVPRAEARRLGLDFDPVGDLAHADADAAFTGPRTDERGGTTRNGADHPLDLRLFVTTGGAEVKDWRRVSAGRLHSVSEPP